MTLPSILPDVALLALSALLLLAGLAGNAKSERLAFPAAIGGTAFLFLLSLLVPPSPEKHLGCWTVTPAGLHFRQLFLFATLLVEAFARSYFRRGGDGKGALERGGEFLATLHLVLLGAFAVVSVDNLLALFVGLELATIPLYCLVAWRSGDRRGGEAAVKYVVMGAGASCFVLFSFSYLYGLAGSLDFGAIATRVASIQDGSGSSGLLRVAVAALFAGVGFKLTIFPFQMWAPDVYEGAPTPVTLLLSVVSKSAAVAFLLVLMHGPLAPALAKTQELVLVLSALTMTVGNLGAIHQRHLRRFMAYSSVAQAGFILAALVGPADRATAAALYYLFIYAATNTLAFAVFAVAGEERGETFECLRGLSRRSPALAGILAVCMFSLAGIPPVAGFVGKFFLFSSAASAGHYLFVVFAALNGTLSLYYYLRVLREAYIVPEEEGKENGALRVDPLQKVLLGCLLLAVAAMGLVPQISDFLSR